LKIRSRIIDLTQRLPGLVLCRLLDRYSTHAALKHKALLPTSKVLLNGCKEPKLPFGTDSLISTRVLSTAKSETPLADRAGYALVL
jgi:hypothetical protein